MLFTVYWGDRWKDILAAALHHGRFSLGPGLPGNSLVDVGKPRVALSQAVAFTQYQGEVGGLLIYHS